MPESISSTDDGDEFFDAVDAEDDKNKDEVASESVGDAASAADAFIPPQPNLSSINLLSSPTRVSSTSNVTDSPLNSIYSIGAQGGRKSLTRTSSVKEVKNNSIRLFDVEEIEQLDVDRPATADSDVSSNSDSSTSIEKKYQIIDKDTGKVHDVRDVMKEIHVTGLDTNYSLLPTRNQLKHQMSSRRLSSFRSSDSKDDSDHSGTYPIDVGDNVATNNDEKIVMVEKKSGSIKFPKFPKPSSIMAENLRKGIKGMAELKAKVELKAKAEATAPPRNLNKKPSINRRRTQSADKVPGNAVHVRSSAWLTRSSGNVGSSHDAHHDSSFNPMLLIKTIPNAHDGPAWCASFSRDGRFLATGGGDGNVCIWKVAPKSKDLHPDGDEEPTNNEAGTDEKKCVPNDNVQNNASSSTPPLHFIGTGPALATNLEILSSEPIRRYKDHTTHVIDLSWSRTNFLLSASLDGFVRLYHYSKSECLHSFQHAASVASVAFHPKEDRFFISGGVDKKLRMWDITDGRVKEWSQAPDAITATRFTPDGKYAVAGLFHGQVYFYEVIGLKYYTQIACKNRSGKYAKGSKVTGISFVREERDDWSEVKQKFVPDKSEPASPIKRLSEAGKGLNEAGLDVAKRMLHIRSPSKVETLRYNERMLVSTNDSRLRLFGLNDFCLVRKYKGHTNCCKYYHKCLKHFLSCQ
jgi:WD40 repeat protein